MINDNGLDLWEVKKRFFKYKKMKQCGEEKKTERRWDFVIWLKPCTSRYVSHCYSISHLFSINPCIELPESILLLAVSCLSRQGWPDHTIWCGHAWLTCILYFVLKAKQPKAEVSNAFLWSWLMTHDSGLCDTNKSCLTGLFCTSVYPGYHFFWGSGPLDHLIS